MKIEVPPEIFGVRKWECTVRSNHNVATFIKELVLELPDGRDGALPRGRLHPDRMPAAHRRTTRTSTIEEEYRGDWDKFDLWRYVVEGRRDR